MNSTHEMQLLHNGIVKTGGRAGGVNRRGLFDLAIESNREASNLTIIESAIVLLFAEQKYIIQYINRRNIHRLLSTVHCTTLHYTVKYS